MISDNQKAENFLEAINQDAKKRCDKIKQDVDRYIASELQKARAIAHEEVKALKKAEYDKLNELNNSSLSENEAGETKLLIARRTEITDDIFGSVIKRLEEFVSGESYLDFLKSSVSRLQSGVGKDAVIILRPQDKKYEAQLSSLCKEIRYDESIKLGGCRAENPQEHLAADDTLETRLNEEKQNFYKNSGLSITL